MKKIILSLLIVFAFSFGTELKATHYAGAEITYKHISGNQYEITLIVYRDNSGAAIGAGNENVCVSGSCGSSANVSLPKIAPPTGNPGSGGNLGWAVDGLRECADASDPNNTNLVDISKHVWRGTTTLSCLGDWTFSWASCCRNNAISNLVSPGSRDMYVEAKLNNRFGPNTSPQFVTEAAKTFCVGKPFVWSQAAIEPDGDSLYYDFGTPQEYTSFGCPVTGVDIPFSGGYTQSNPMTTTNGINIDHANGAFRFTPSQAEVVVIRVDINEYRFDTAALVWKNIGNSVRDMQVVIAANCKSGVADGPKIVIGSGTGNTLEQFSGDNLDAIYGVPSFNNDSVGSGSSVFYTLPVIPYNCFDSELTLDFDVDVLCETIVPTDFRLVGPDSIARPIVDINDQCRPDLTTEQIKLALYKTLDVNGDYLLYVKTGNDGNTLTNRCGFALIDYYAMIIRVNNCPDLDYELENVTVNLDENIEIFWRANDTTYDASLFDSWKILRSNNDQVFYEIADVQDVNARSYLDTGLIGWDVDNQIYQYMIQGQFNGKRRAPTNFINSVVLYTLDTLRQGQTVNLEWNNYDGWPNAQYEVFRGKYDTSIVSINWTLLENVGGALSRLTDIPEPDETNSGLYFFKVEAIDPNDPTWRSESNWLNYGIVYDPPRIPTIEYIPNVFTPNNDGSNDRFWIKPGAKPYSDIALSVYDRNGALVFSSPEFHKGNNDVTGWDGSDANGQLLPDGVYFYSIDFSDQETGMSEIRNGQITLASGRR